MNSSLCFVTTLLSAALAFSSAQAETPPSATVDQNGVLRWTDSGAEIAQFGVNYTAPFAYAFRAHRRLGIPIEQAIDADVYHFARLGFDAYRVHIWDREISDAEGNLLVNEHVRAFDYLLWRLKERRIKIVLTALQFGDAGYPEPGAPLPGFSSKYDKRGSLEDRGSWPLQERYLTQLMNHVNPRTGIAYKDDPDVIGVEICNEPGHFEYALTLDYINTMAQAIRSTGCLKPIFYNMSHGIPVHQAYLDANVQGGTFQWYPTNLLAGHEQRGNFLPYVDDYPIPFASEPKFKNKAKIAYEFDAADVGRSYIYPAMARAFRKAGFQFATQFAYDPLYLAPYNTEYQTHYLNLAYSPSKAIGMKIAGEAFRRSPLGHDYGAYPKNTTFAGVHLDYVRDLAELVTDTEYFYSNSTNTEPANREKLEHVAGFGSSPVGNYPGAGAYFIDRLEPGVWRLEVMPDAIWVRDPFERPSPQKQVARIAWNRWPMRLHLSDLGEDFNVTGLNTGNSTRITARGGEFPITPGTYLLTRAGGRTTRWKPNSSWQNITLKEFVAPAASIDRVYVLHTAPTEASAGHPITISAVVAAPNIPDSVELVAYAPRNIEEALQPRPKNPLAQPGGGNARRRATAKIQMQPQGLNYTAEIPGELLREGNLQYYIVVKSGERATSFPSAVDGQPGEWSFVGEPWTVRVTSPEAPLLVFDSAVDAKFITADHRDVNLETVASDRPGTTALVIPVPELADEPHDYSWRFYFKDKIEARHDRLSRATKLAIFGRSFTAQPCLVQLALVTSDGVTFGATTLLQPQNGVYTIDVSALKPVRSPNIPHGYPVFIPFWSAAPAGTTFDLNKVESVLVSIGPGIPEAEWTAPHAIAVERIWLE